MATLAENAAAVKAAQEDIDEAIRTKGGTTDGGLTNAAAAIAALPSGGGIGDDYAWQKPKLWPDIQKILIDHHDENHLHSFIFLLEAQGDAIALTGSGVAKYETSDGAVYTANTTHTWDKTKDIAIENGRKARWMIAHCDVDNINLWNNSYFSAALLWVASSENAYLNNPSFMDYSQIRCIDCGIKLSTSGFQWMFVRAPLDAVRGRFYSDGANATGQLYAVFRECSSIKFVTGRLAPISSTGGLGISQFFYTAYSLVDANLVLDAPTVTDCSSLFYQCRSLLHVSDIMNLSSCTNCSGMFNGCKSLRNIPSRPTLITNIDFSAITNSSGLFDRNSVATFDGETGEVNGGFAGNINTIADSHTVSFGNAIRACFTADEWAKIVAVMSNKGWSVSPSV